MFRSFSARARECTGFSPVEKESGVVRTLRGVTNCPNIPATGALWVRTPQLWESQQENRQTRLSFGRQINLASYLPGDNIAFPLEKQRPEDLQRGISFCRCFPGEESATSWEWQAGLVPVVVSSLASLRGCLLNSKARLGDRTPAGPSAQALFWRLLAGATSPDSEPPSPDRQPVLEAQT